MSALTDRIAREHVIVWGHHGWACAACGWEALPQTGSHEASRIHVAEVTEAAVRAELAAEYASLAATAHEQLRATRRGTRSESYYGAAAQAFETAARIARGGAA